jgi:MerR family transcriptional regulator, heat shock protein HspR
VSTRRGQVRTVYMIGIAAELAGMHPQTLRVYERRGLITPSRTEGNTRVYSDADVALLRRIQELSDQGLNLSGIERVLDLEVRLARAEERARVAEKTLAEYDAATRQRLRDLRRETCTEIVVIAPTGTDLVPRYRPVIRGRRAH